MVNYKELKVGDELIFHWDDFDGSGEKECTVVDILEDSAVANHIDGIYEERYWIDEDTQHMFDKR